MFGERWREKCNYNFAALSFNLLQIPTKYLLEHFHMGKKVETKLELQISYLIT